MLVRGLIGCRWIYGKRLGAADSRGLFFEKLTGYFEEMQDGLDYAKGLRSFT